MKRSRQPVNMSRARAQALVGAAMVGVSVMTHQAEEALAAAPDDPDQVAWAKRLDTQASRALEGIALIRARYLGEREALPDNGEPLF